MTPEPENIDNLPDKQEKGIVPNPEASKSKLNADLEEYKEQILASESPLNNELARLRPSEELIEVQNPFMS